MRRAWPVLVILVIAATAIILHSRSQRKGIGMTEQPPQKMTPEELEAEVEKACEAIRAGNCGPSPELWRYGRAVVPPLVPYLRDPNDDVRRHVVALLKAVEDPAAVPPLLQAMADPEIEIQQRAATALYEAYDPQLISKQPSAGQTLRKSVAAGNTSAAALLLLGYAGGKETTDLLSQVREKSAGKKTKLYDWSPAVTVTLPANVALSLLGDEEARAALIETTANDNLDELRFLLSVLREVDSPRVLHAVGQALDDTRLTGSGAPRGADSPRRLCDDTVNAFVDRLRLEIDFPLTDAQTYSDAQIDQVRQLIRAAIPQ